MICPNCQGAGYEYIDPGNICLGTVPCLECAIKEPLTTTGRVVNPDAIAKATASALAQVDDAKAQVVRDYLASEATRNQRGLQKLRALADESGPLPCSMLVVGDDPGRRVWTGDILVNNSDPAALRELARKFANERRLEREPR